MWAITDLDEAELFLQQHGIPHSRLSELMADEEALKKLRRKVDWTLMPLLCGTYLLQYVDKQALGYSAVFAKSTERLAHPDPCSQKKNRILILASIYTVSVVLL